MKSTKHKRAKGTDVYVKTVVTGQRTLIQKINRKSVSKRRKIRKRIRS